MGEFMNIQQGAINWLKPLQEELRSKASGNANGEALKAVDAAKLGGIAAGWYATVESTEMTLLNGWTYADETPSYTPKACRSGFNVIITGVITGGETAEWTTLFILPPSMRPKRGTYFSSSSYEGFCAFFIASSGIVSVIRMRADVPNYINCAFGLD